MTSDWRLLDEPLGKFVCGVCACARRATSPSTGPELFTSGYLLYARPPGEPHETARQALYAGWIAAAVSQAPRRVVDIGCANGSLLLALRAVWPDAELLGCDPSGEAVAHGAARGLHVWRGTVADLDPDIAADLVISVNVVEHLPDPGAFTAGVGRALAPDGRAVVVCPDGGSPNVELLFADHLSSFAPEHLRALVATAGLDVLAHSRAPADLGAFQMVVARHGRVRARDVWPDAASLTRARRAYLQRWEALDAALVARLPPTVVCFGIGEAAGLLRAYAPAVWQRVQTCTADDAAAGRFGHTPVVPLDRVDDSSTLLLGIRPMDQRRVADRLRERFANVVTWYDLVELTP